MMMKSWKDASKTSQGESTSRGGLPQAAGEEFGPKLTALLEDPLFNELLHIQHMTPITWAVSPQWKISWLTRLLASPSGGVSDILSGVI